MDNELLYQENKRLREIVKEQRETIKRFRKRHARKKR